jgi:perosamine synthetase
MHLNIVNIIKKILGDGFHPLHEPYFCGKEWKYLRKTLDDNYVSSVGSFVNKFEEKIKRLTNAKYAISLVNGTAALHLSLIACGVKKNDEVLVPSITFAGTANAVTYSGAIPHFIDSEFYTLGIDPIKLEKYLDKIAIKKGKFYFNKKTNRRVSAIIPVHVFGNICQIDKILKVARKYNLIVIEDAAEALGSFFKNKHAGNFGIAGCFSFNGNKILTTGGGGAVITNNRILAKKIKHLSTTAKINHRWEYIHDTIGYNFRMPNLNAALGLAQIENLNRFLKSKRKLHKNYAEKFRLINSIKLIEEQKFSKSNCWLNAIIIKDSSLKKRNMILEFGHRNKIFLRPAWKPLHTLKHFNNMPMMNLDNSIKIYESCINLPSSASYFYKKK